MRPPRQDVAARVPNAVLEHWYFCGRKIAYATEPIAALQVWSERNGHFACPLGFDHWHVGRKAQQHPLRYRWRQRARQAWRRARADSLVDRAERGQG